MWGILGMGKRNYFLDFWKFIAAIGVILVHIPFPGKFGTVMTCVGTWGVGFFAIISGYACCGESKVMSKKILKRFVRNGIITALAIALYMTFSYFAYKSDNILILWQLELKKPMTFVKMIFMGDFEFFYGSPLWYMVALLYCYLILFVLVRFNLKKVIYVLCPIFAVARIIVDSYVNSFGANWHYSGNALIGVLPMMLLGYVIADNKEKLMKIPTWILILGSVLTAAAMFTFVCVKVGHFDISQPFKMLCASFMLILGAKKPNWYIIKPIAYLGREDSLYIYLFHFILLYYLSVFMYSYPKAGRYAAWQLPLLVIIVSVVFARIVSMIVFFFKWLFKKLFVKKSAAQA